MNKIEGKARRLATRCGYRVARSRQRECVPNADNFGELMLVDADTNFVVSGSQFDLSPEDVIEICEAELKRSAES